MEKQTQQNSPITLENIFNIVFEYRKKLNDLDFDLDFNIELGAFTDICGYDISITVNNCEIAYDSDNQDTKSFFTKDQNLEHTYNRIKTYLEYMLVEAKEYRKKEEEDY